MNEKPRQWQSAYAQIWKDQSVVDAYRFRPEYPGEVFKTLEGLMAPERPRAMLDVGCGTGYIARPLLAIADRVDAVDFSRAMIAAGRRLPGGDDPRLNWIHGPIEEVSLSPPYALITAGASLHWMDWDVALPRFVRALAPDAYLATVDMQFETGPWSVEFQPVLARYSMNEDFQPYSMLTVVEELQARGLFQQIGVAETAAITFHQTAEDWVESFHARNGLSRDRMEPAAAAACDQEIWQIINRYFPSGEVQLPVSGRVIWGRPVSE